MKEYKWHDWLVCVMFLLLIGVGLGYAWRMHHESISKASSNTVMMPANSISVADLSHEINKGRKFWLRVDDNTMLHFLPLKGARFQMAIRNEPRE